MEGARELGRTDTKPAMPNPASSLAPTTAQLTTIPIWAIRGGRPELPDQAETEAREAAESVAAGRPAGVRTAAARTGASGSGVALPGAFRSTLERSLGADLSTVRIHVDASAGAAVRSVRARAVTFGEDIAVAPGGYRPEETEGRMVLAHEVTHVVQQRATGARPQYLGEGEAPGAKAGEEPVWISASLRGLRVSSPGHPMPAGELALRAYLRIVLGRIVPAATPAQVETVLDRIAADPGMIMTGSIAPGVVIAAGEQFAPVTIRPAAFAAVAAILGEMGIKIDLTPEQRRILRLGVVAEDWADEAVAALQRDYSWYSRGIWQAQLDMHTQLLAEAAAAEEAAPAGTRPAAGRDALIAQLRPPLDVLEAIRNHRPLARAQAGPGTRESRDSAIVAGTWNLLWGKLAGVSDASQEQLRIRAIQFYWTAPARYHAAVRDHAAQVDFLRRMGNWLQRSLPAVDPHHDYTQELVRDPGRFTDQPFPAHLEAVPAPSGDLRIVPADAEHHYRFSVDFTDVFDAFGSYAYRWDVLGWRAKGSSTAQSIKAIEAGQTDADRRRTDRYSTHHSDVLAARLERDIAHARADVRMLAETLGPASVTMAPTAIGVFELRALATAVRTLVDIVTLENGPGIRERMIQLPGPGLWVIRATAVPIFGLADEIHRAPSVAYIPVYALAQRELASRALAEAVTASEAEEQGRREARAALTAFTAPDADPALRAMAGQLAADPRLGTDRWAALEATQRDLQTRLDEIQHSLDDTSKPPASPAELDLLRGQRDALKQQIKQNGLLLDTHHGRVARHPALAHPQALIASLVTDEGQTVPLRMEWAEETRDAASSTVTATARPGSRFVLLSDHTSPNSGLEEGTGRSLDEAVRSALKNLLEGRNGYGRGLVAVRLPSGSSVSLRIEASLGSLLNESLDDVTTLITLVALAAAPFTEGASLIILVPVGVVAGVRAAERMYARYDASTLRWDLQTLQDFVDVASAAVGVGSAVRGAKAGLQVSRIGRIAAISFDVAQNVTGFIILGVRLKDQLQEIDATPGLSAAERRARRMMALGGALVAAGMQGGTLLITHAYGGRPEPEVPHPGADPPVHPAETTTPGPAADPGTTHPLVDPATHPVVDPATHPVVEPPAAGPVPATAPARRPASIDDMLTPEGQFRPEYPDLASAWDAYADRTRSGGRDPLTPREWALSQFLGAPARALQALLPPGWRRGARAVFPGGRPAAVALNVESPAPGTPVAGTGLSWKSRVVRTAEIRRRMDNTGEQYWSFPELRPGEVLVLPNGSRIWIDPLTGAIVDSNPVGPPFGRLRKTTRGEEVLFTAAERSPEHAEAGTQRLHGASSPGLGADAPYSIVYGPPRLNLVIENAGIEQWVRALRDNAPPGVQYVYTTRTQRSPRGDLISRSYEVAALEAGQTTPIASFEVRMRGGGLTDADVEVPGWHVFTAGLERYGAPRLLRQPASRPPGGDVSVDIPRSLREAVGGGSASDPRPASPLTAPLQAAQATRARLGALAERADLSGTTPAGASELLFELDDALVRAETRMLQGPVDAESIRQLNAIVTRINEITRIRTRTDRLSTAELRALAQLLDRIGFDR